MPPAPPPRRETEQYGNKAVRMSVGERVEISGGSRMKCHVLRLSARMWQTCPEEDDDDDHGRPFHL